MVTIAFVTKERLLRAVGHDLRDTNFLNATEPERVGEPDTHLLVMLGRTKHRRTIVVEGSVWAHSLRCSSSERSLAARTTAPKGRRRGYKG